MDGDIWPVEHMLSRKRKKEKEKKQSGEDPKVFGHQRCIMTINNINCSSNYCKVNTSYFRIRLGTTDHCLFDAILLQSVQPKSEILDLPERLQSSNLEKEHWGLNCLPNTYNFTVKFQDILLAY